jgi:hypothetical protein
VLLSNAGDNKRGNDLDKVHDSEYMRVRDNLILYWDRWASRIELGESIAVFWLQQFYGIDEVKARACLGQLAGEGLLAVSTQYSLGPRGRARVQELARGSVTLELILLLLYNTGRADLQTPDARNRAAAAFGFDTPLADGAQVGLLQLGYLDEHRQHTLTEQGRAAVDRAQAEVQQRLDAELQEALVDCFPTPTALKYAVEFGLRVKPNLILGDGSQGELVAQVMRWAKANGREQDLAAMARQYAPANPKLLAFHARLMYDQVCVAATEFMGDVYQLSMLARIHLNICCLRSPLAEMCSAPCRILWPGRFARGERISCSTRCCKNRSRLISGTGLRRSRPLSNCSSTFRVKDIWKRPNGSKPSTTVCCLTTAPKSLPEW